MVTIIRAGFCLLIQRNSQEINPYGKRFVTYTKTNITTNWRHLYSQAQFRNGKSWSTSKFTKRHIIQ